MPAIRSSKTPKSSATAMKMKLMGNRRLHTESARHPVKTRISVPEDMEIDIEVPSKTPSVLRTPTRTPFDHLPAHLPRPPRRPLAENHPEEATIALMSVRLTLGHYPADSMRRILATNAPYAVYWKHQVSSLALSYWEHPVFRDLITQVRDKIENLRKRPAARNLKKELELFNRQHN